MITNLITIKSTQLIFMLLYTFTVQYIFRYISSFHVSEQYSRFGQN
jgi:hypothetical protein